MQYVDEFRLGSSLVDINVAVAAEQALAQPLQLPFRNTQFAGGLAYRNGEFASVFGRI